MRSPPHESQGVRRFRPRKIFLDASPCVAIYVLQHLLPRHPDMGFVEAEAKQEDFMAAKKTAKKAAKKVTKTAKKPAAAKAAKKPAPAKKPAKGKAGKR